MILSFCSLFTHNVDASLIALYTFPPSILGYNSFLAGEGSGWLQDGCSEAHAGGSTHEG